MDKFLAVLLQVLDYVIKAVANYRLTPEGEKEWKDIFDAWASIEEAELNPDIEFRDNDNPPTVEDVAAVQRRQVRSQRVNK